MFFRSNEGVMTNCAYHSIPGVGGRLPLKHDGIQVYDENCIKDRNYGVFYTSDMGGYIFLGK